MQKAFVKHYRQPFGSQTKGRIDPACGSLLESLPQLDADERERLEEPISIEVVYGAIDNSPNTKTSGPDGIGAEFYKKVQKLSRRCFVTSVFPSVRT